MKCIRLSIAIIVFLLIAVTGNAQTAVTSVHGAVLDQSGAAIPGAHASITNPETGFKSERVTDGRGEYAFEQIAPGRYKIQVSATGFADQNRTAELLVNQPRVLDFKMSVASSGETVEVDESAMSLNTSDATIGTPFDTTQIQALPFEGNNVLDLLSLQAGVLFLGDKTSTSQDTDSRSGAVDGARSDQSNTTLDGLDDNDQNKGYAFTGVLRSTRDSVEEFRVVTTNANADSGGSSGAQVSLVTRSGTNVYHGSAYEYYRPTNTVANNWFLKQSQVAAGLPNVPSKELRNTFGGSFGAPIKKDKLFYFVAFEGQRTAESLQVFQEVPSAAFRNGMLTYVTGSGSETKTLTPADIASMDPNCSGNGTCPLGAGVNPAALAYYNSLPQSNTVGTTDGYNLFGYTFASPAPQSLNTLIAKFDYNIHDKHRLFLRANDQRDRTSGTEQFPGQPPSYTLVDDSKGIAVGDIWTISNSLVNNLRYGLVHQSYSNTGVTNGNYVTFQNISTLKASGYTSQVISVPTNNVVDDINWTKGAHSIQAGGNYRLVFNNRRSNATLFSNAAVTYQLLAVGAIANTSVNGQPPASLDPGGFGFPAVSSSFDTAYNTAIADITGLITSSTVYYNNVYSNGQLSALPPGEWVNHQYITNEVEYYAQDSWKIKPNLTITYGLRHTLLQVPYERNGQEIVPTIDMGQWFNNRTKAAAAGNIVQPTFGFTQGGRANGRPGFWSMDKFDIAPRLGIAYSLDARTTIRAGAGIYYDHFGQGIVDSFDQQGSFGLVTADRSPVGQYVDTTPRYSDQTTVPTSIVPTLSVTGPTPVTPGPNLSLAWGVDQSLTTPYSYVLNTSVQHQFSKSFILEGTYTGRLGRHLLQMRDIATPSDLKDPQSGLDYFAAAKLLSKLTDAGAAVTSVQPIPYWENMFPWLAGGGLTATQQAYQQFQPFRGNEASALFVLDAIPGFLTPDNELYRYFDPQYSSLYTWSSMGTSSYHGLQLTLHHPQAHGVQFDVYYTLSKSIDLGSDAERTGPSTETIGGGGGYYSGSGGYFSQIINVYNPKGNRGVSDFDVRHSITGNAIAGLPLGHGQLLGGGANKITDAIIGHWTVTGLTHWTSGLPFGSIDGIGWSTDWADQSWIVNTGHIASGGHNESGSEPNAFKNQAEAGATSGNIRPPYAGEAGQRNAYRGDGYFSVDTGLTKILNINDKQQLKFAWETFNATNSVRFDPASISDNPYGSPGSYGDYNALLTQGRRMQLSLRYSF